MTPEPSPGSETILLVEQQKEFRSVIRRVLESRGYRVLVATNGDEALRVAMEFDRPGLPRQLEIDLLVTNLDMPGVSGFELGSLLAPAHPRMRILYLSADPPERFAEAAASRPGSKLLAWPFTAEELARTVREALDAEPQW